MKNQLAKETSPYLLQHKDNPVAWLPWGEEAFEQAKAADKPVLLSVGYSACHWCHVMAHESFEDQETAELMNEYFVNIKVDREERPDVDAIYMSAVQAMTGSGGWPMTVVMTPEGKPFFGGTYFPKQARHGQPAFQQVLLGLADAWQHRRDEVNASAGTMTQYLTRLASAAYEGEVSSELTQRAVTRLSQSFDEGYGGFAKAPKFPPHSVLRFLLLHASEHAKDMAHFTLEMMAKGGIYDQLGGGFARYSVDAIWRVPHFEKMLYDNAQLVQRYTEAFQDKEQARYKQVVDETLAWVQREMMSPEYGFYSALDADSEGEEGKYYLWDETELDTLLEEDSEFAKALYGFVPGGNFEGQMILERRESLEALKQQFSLSDIQAKVSSVQTRLLAYRETRVRPGLDDKVLTSWNGLMLAGFADASRVFKRKDYLEVAVKNADFLLEALYKEGRLCHSYKEGQAKIPGLLEDYAYLGLGLLALYRASFVPRYFDVALGLAETILKHFHDEENGGFFSTADDSEALIIRPKNYFDSPNPSENAAAAELLLRLARFTHKPTWEEIALRTIKTMAQAMRDQASGFGALLSATQLYLAKPQEIAIFAQLEQEETKAFLALIDKKASAFASVALVSSADELKHVPFVQNRAQIDGLVTAYVCENGVCTLPVTSLEGLEKALL